jgi:hypothetical protein
MDLIFVVAYGTGGHVARMGRRGMNLGFWWESQKEGDY